MFKKNYRPKQDALPPFKEDKTIYDVDNWTIIRKNFIAGIGRSAGSWFFNIVIIGTLVYFLIPVLSPKVEQLNNNFQEINKQILENLSVSFK